MEEFATYIAITELERFRFREPKLHEETEQFTYDAQNEPDAECELNFNS